MLFGKVPRMQQYFCILVMFILFVSSGCRPSLRTTYSIDEQYTLYATRLPQMNNQLEFSIRLDPERVPYEQDIFFVAVFTNTTEQPIVFREPRQHGVIETSNSNVTLLFTVEPINPEVSFKYPGEIVLEGLTELMPIQRGEFSTLAPYSKHEIRLKLPRLVFRNSMLEDAISLPPGQYRIHMTYNNRHIGYRVIEQGGEMRYVDLGAWVGEVEASPALLTITP